MNTLSLHTTAEGPVLLDDEGGVWHPDPIARTIIRTAPHPEVEALRQERLGNGEWKH